MADKGISGDWTAGIVAIIAALLIGAGIPVGVYFGLYKPKEAQRKDAEMRFGDLKLDEMRALAEVEKVKKMQAEAKDMEARVAEIEAPFSVRDEAKEDVPLVREDLQKMCSKHHLELRDVYRQVLGAEIVYLPQGKRQITFENGLKATSVVVEVQGTFHDFGRFVAELEMWDKAVVIAEGLDCIGDSNGGRVHSFILQVCVIEKRDMTKIGT